MKIAVRAPNWIGDSVLSLAAIKSLSRNFPRAEIWVAAKEWVKNVYTSCGFIKGIIPLPETNDLKSLKNSTQKLKEFHFDIGVLLTNSFASALLFYLAKIPQRWGYSRDGRGILLTKAVSVNPQDSCCHQLDYYLRLLSGLGLKTDPPSLFFSLSQEEKETAKQLLLSIGVDFRRPIVTLHPGASYGPAKRWPVAKFAVLATLFQEKERANILLTGAPNETGLVKAVSSLMNVKPFNLAGQTNLRALAGLIHLSRLFVTNDSGPMHLANALRTPVVTIFGPTNPAITGPFQEPSAVIKKEVPCWPCSYRECPFDHRCMVNIEPEEVFEVCSQFFR